jgi:hypothetical protein
MIAVEVQHHLGRAREFLEGMRTLRDEDEDYGYSTALLGIHAAISYCDALRKGMGQMDLTAEDHLRALDDLKRLLRTRKFASMQGADRLGKLTAKKSKVAYRAVTLRVEEVDEILKDSERFAIWAEDAGRILKIEGWRNA